MQKAVKKLILLFFILSIASPVYAKDKRKEAAEYYQKGDLYYKQGKYQEAQAEFQKALEVLAKKDEAVVTKTEEEKISPKEQAAASPQETKPSLEYVIGEEDTLYISVWQNPDLSDEVIVRPDGKISFPLIGDVRASGLTISRLDQEITERLKEYIKFPEVSISIRKLGGKKVIILGEVQAPGVYLMTGKSTVLEAIAMAGGFTNDATVSSVILVKGGFANPKGVRLNLNRPLIKGDLTYNVTLHPEDIIFVPKRFISNVNYVVNTILGPIMQGSYSTELLRDKRW
jgi:polysaccharide export outer membrane protein